MTFDAYKVHECGDRNYAVTLVNTRTGAQFRTSAVACGRQAHYMVTRGLRRPMRFLGVATMRAGEVVQTTFPERCDITDPLHVHAHQAELPKVDA